MREIKFRAWYKPTDYDESEPKKPPRMVYFDKLGYCDEYNHLEFQLAEDSRDPDGGDYSNLCASVENFIEVMQFTGLRDKNGKEIYEGDILGFETELGHSEKTVAWADGDVYSGWNISRAYCDGEVIGNIYENQDLVCRVEDKCF